MDARDKPGHDSRAGCARLIIRLGAVFAGLRWVLHFKQR